MNIIDIIAKKRDKHHLTKQEIEFFVNGYVANKIPDYQVSALMMAIVFKGMTMDEIVNLTDVMEQYDIVFMSSVSSLSSLMLYL